MLGLFVEPRYHFTVPNSVLEPFLAGRAYYLHDSISQGGDAVTANGFGLGTLAGIFFRLTPQFGLEPGVTFTYISFGDAKFNGTSIDGTDTSGSSLGVQLAFVVGFARR